jgi:hypothetical protein
MYSARCIVTVSVGRTVSRAVLVRPPKAAEIVTDFVVFPGLVVIVKLALVTPAATVTLGATLATAASLLESVTMVPPVTAALLSVTVPCVEAPPVTLVGFNVSEESVVVGAGVGVGVG